MSQTVQRALSIVEFIAERPRSLGEVAGHLGVHRSTALGLLHTLREGGFARIVGGRYTVGLRLVALAHQALDQLDLHPVAHPHLVRLADRHGHTGTSPSWSATRSSTWTRWTAGGALRLSSRVGRPVNPQTSGVGKAILAYLDEASRERFLARISYQAYTATSITSPEALRAELARTAARGWAEDDGEYEEVVACVAAPVRDARGRVVAAVSVTAPRVLAPLERLRGCLPDLTDTCAAISRDLGWTGGDQP